MTISKSEIEKRFVFPNMEVYKKLEEQDKSIAMMLAHYGSYEWVISMNAYVKFSAFAIYKKVANPYFDQLVRDIRSKFKASLVTTKETIPTIINNNRIGKLSIYGFASDQSPKISSAFHWQKFMGIEVPVHTGAEMLAKKYDLSVIFIKVKKVGRGYYEATIIPIADNPKEYENFDVTEKYLREVEKQIYEAPEYYLWTHKRWKHRVQ